MREEKVILNGQPFHLRRWGEDSLPVLLMLHGFPEYGGAWEDLAARLSHRFHCVAPDQRGYGHSWAPEEVDSYGAAHLTGDMAALIGHLGRGPVHVMGHDWGAAVAYGLAMFRPDLVRRLIIANGVHPVPFQRALARGGAQCEASQYIRFLRRPDSHDILAANDFEKMMAVFSAKMDLSWMTVDLIRVYKAEWSRGGRLKTMIHWYRASPLVVGEPGVVLDDLPPLPLDKLHVRCPHLLLWGAGDTALLSETTEGLEEFASDLTRVDISDADHWLIHQKPDEVAAAMLEWLPEK